MVAAKGLKTLVFNYLTLTPVVLGLNPVQDSIWNASKACADLPLTV